MASPQNTPVASRQGRHSSSGPHAPGASRPPAGRLAANRERPQSRSATMQLTAHSTKNARKMSRRASRDSTSWMPSKHISRPATRPRSVDRVTRLASRIITSTISEPDDGGSDPPAERRHPEDALAQGDDPLPDLGVDHHVGHARPEPVHVAGQDLLVRLVDVGLGVAVVQQRPGVLGVVGLVELERPRLAEVPQPEERREQGDRHRPDPRDHRVVVPGTQPGAGGRVRHLVARGGAGEPDGCSAGPLLGGRALHAGAHTGRDY